MIVEVAAVVTAIATASSAIYMVMTSREERLRRAPAIKIHSAEGKDGCALIQLSIYPTDHHVWIQRVSSNAAGIAKPTDYRDEEGRVIYKGAQNYFPFIDVDLDLLPRHAQTSSVRQHFSVKLRKNQSSVQISFHSSRKRFAAKHKVTAMISNEAD